MSASGIRDEADFDKNIFETIPKYLQQCEIKLMDSLEIGSYCSIIERELKKRVESYMNKWTRFEAPKLVDKLEAKLQKKIGEEVVIELISF